MVRIASSDFELLKKFCASLEGAQAVPVASGDLTASANAADLFLLGDAEAVALAEACGEGMRPTLISLVVDGEPLPKAFTHGLTDDLLTLPLRASDAHRILRAHTQAEALRAMSESSRGIPELVQRLQADIAMAEKIQRRLIREKFPPMGGLTIKSKYWCGLKAGGDYFDVFEFPDGEHVGLILSDSSSYGLSTTFIGSLMQFSMHVSQADLSDPSRIVASLFAKLESEMKEKDRFSLFYGVLSRKTYQLRYVDCGSVYGALKSEGNKISWITEGKNPPLTKGGISVPALREVALEPGDRFMLASDGWSESLNSSMGELVERFLGGPADAQDLMNEMAFWLRKGVVKHYELDDGEEESFPMPPQDCSVLLFDLAKNALRLAK